MTCPPTQGRRKCVNSWAPPPLEPSQELLPQPIPHQAPGPHLHANTSPDPGGPQPLRLPGLPPTCWAQTNRVFFLEAPNRWNRGPWLSEQPEVRVHEGEDRRDAGALRGLGVGVWGPLTPETLSVHTPSPWWPRAGCRLSPSSRACSLPGTDHSVAKGCLIQGWTSGATSGQACWMGVTQ